MKNFIFTAALVTLVLVHTNYCSAEELPKMAAATEQHEWLTRFVGEWKSEAEAFMGEGQPALRCEGRQQARMLGDIWMISEGQVEMMGVNVKSVMTLGYDPKKEKYVGTWIDSFHNHLWRYVGEVDDAGKTLTLDTEGPSFTAPGETAKYREVIEFKNKDHYVFSSMVQGDDGEWFTFMTANFRRKE